MATVTVLAPYQVAHDGIVYLPGEEADVPDELAEHWLALGYVHKKAQAKKTAPK